MTPLPRKLAFRITALILAGGGGWHLDAAFPGNPVRIEHVSMHGAVMNSLALECYDISAATETPPGGVIVRKPGTNEPWGLIMETAFLPVIAKSETMTAQQELDWPRAGQMLYAAAGITTAHEGATHHPQFQTIKRASDAGPPELMELENSFAKALRSVNSFHVHGDELELLSDGDIVATFKAALSRSHPWIGSGGIPLLRCPG